ncbi:hypothetical protein G6F62_014575 [Rhizopus arrhizus]|nr:hypothetical protein G6F62_014575 [Rhizopus arrhizus]
MDRREHEADAGLLDRGGHLRRLQLDGRAQRFHRIGAAGFGRHAAVAVLGDRHAGRRRHEHGGGRNVERVAAVAARAAHIQQILRIRRYDGGGEFAHDLRGRGDLADGFLFHAQAHQQGAGDLRRHLAAHQHAHQMQHLVVENFAARFRKLRSRAWPC